MKLDRIVRATIWMHLSESVYFTVQSCLTAFQLWKTLSNTYEKKVATTKIYLIQRLYNLRMKVTISIMSKDAQRKTFTHESANDSFMVQSVADQPNSRGRSSSQQSANARGRRKSRDTRMCNYCKKPGHIKDECRALKDNVKVYVQKRTQAVGSVRNNRHLDTQRMSVRDKYTVRERLS